MIKNILLLFISIFVLITAQQIYSDFSTKSSTSLVTISTSDSASTITIYRHSYEANIGIGTAKIRLSSGDYTISATKSGESASQKIHISSSKPVSVSLKLAPILKPVIADSVMAKTNLELINMLPFVGPGLAYRITYSFTGVDNSEMSLTITSPSAQDQQDALNLLKDSGVNTDQYLINYVSAPVSL